MKNVAKNAGHSFIFLIPKGIVYKIYDYSDLTFLSLHMVKFHLVLGSPMSNISTGGIGALCKGKLLPVQLKFYSRDSSALLLICKFMSFIFLTLTRIFTLTIHENTKMP